MLNANALITNHGRDAVRCSGWSDKLTALINDPARVSGQIGPLAPSARFQFKGDKEVFNRVLAQYAALGQKVTTLYLSTDPVGGGGGADFEFSVTPDGTGFLHLQLPGRVALSDLRIPKGVSVEAMPPVSLPIDPEQRAKSEAEMAKIKAFIGNLESPKHP